MRSDGKGPFLAGAGDELFLRVVSYASYTFDAVSAMLLTFDAMPATLSTFDAMPATLSTFDAVPRLRFLYTCD